MSSSDPIFDAVVDAILDSVRTTFGIPLERVGLETMLQEVLFHPRELLGALRAGIVTQREFATAIADRSIAVLVPRPSRSQRRATA